MSELWPKRQTSQCRSCGAEIFWLKTVNGKNMPVNPLEVLPDDSLFDHKRHISHFATCPSAKAHRRAK